MSIQGSTYDNPVDPTKLRVGDKVCAPWGSMGLMTLRVERIAEDGTVYVSRWIFSKSRYSQPRKLVQRREYRAGRMVTWWAVVL